MTQHLIVQSPALHVGHIEMLAALAQAQGVHRLTTCAARLVDVSTDLGVACEVAEYALGQHIDTAWVPAARTLASCKLLALDMDSTLINIECIDELADMAGRKTAVAAITEATMRGEINDFADSLRQRVALLAGLPAAALECV